MPNPLRGSASLRRQALGRHHEIVLMENLKRLTSLQLTMAACGALVVAGVMLSHDNNLGFLPLAIAALCGIGAFAKSKSR